MADNVSDLHGHSPYVLLQQLMDRAPDIIGMSVVFHTEEGIFVSWTTQPKQDLAYLQAHMNNAISKEVLSNGT